MLTITLLTDWLIPCVFRLHRRYLLSQRMRNALKQEKPEGKIHIWARDKSLMIGWNQASPSNDHYHHQPCYSLDHTTLFSSQNLLIL